MGSNRDVTMVASWSAARGPRGEAWRLPLHHCVVYGSCAFDSHMLTAGSTGSSGSHCSFCSHSCVFGPIPAWSQAVRSGKCCCTACGRTGVVQLHSGDPKVRMLRHSR